MSDHRVVRYKNARVVKPGEPRPIIDELWVQGGKITDPQKYFFDVAKRADEEVDCKGLILAPGYIDIQCNGTICNFIDISEALKLSCPQMFPINTLSVYLQETHSLVN